MSNRLATFAAYGIAVVVLGAGAYLGDLAGYQVGHAADALLKHSVDPAWFGGAFTLIGVWTAAAATGAVCDTLESAVRRAAKRRSA